MVALTLLRFKDRASFKVAWSVVFCSREYRNLGWVVSSTTYMWNRFRAGPSLRVTSVIAGSGVLSQSVASLAGVADLCLFVDTREDFSR